MTKENAIKAIVEYFKNNEEDFENVIEQADSYDGYLGDNRYYYMEDLDEFYRDTEPTEFLNRVYYGHDDDYYTTDEHGDKHYSEFCPNRTYFYYNGYGNLVSTDYKDYSAYNDEYFAEKLIDNEYGDYVDLPEEVKDIIEQYANVER